MTGFNMPPGCSPSDIPGNRPEDMAWEAAWEWVEAQVEGLSLEEFHRAILMGVAAVGAEREFLERNPYPDTEADGWVFCGKCGQRTGA